MKIDETKWDQTTIGKLLVLFPGEINRLLLHATSQEIARASLHLSLILWRWYFLKALAHDTSPYLFLHWRKEVEKWPKNGQFIPTAAFRLATPSSGGLATLKTDIKVDFISFEEMPLWVDYQNVTIHKSCRWEFDEKYTHDIKTLIATKPQTNETFRDFIDRYIFYCVFGWYAIEKDVRVGFTKEQWFHYWYEMFYQIDKSGEEGLGTDVLIDQFVLQMRKKLPQYGLLTEEMETYEKQSYAGAASKRINQWAQFWTDFVYYILYPLSWYMPLFAPYFAGRDNFYADVKDTLRYNYSLHTPLHGPPTSIFVTTFGKQYLCR